MAEELIQRNLIESPEQVGEWSFYNIGSTTLKQLKAAKIIPNRDYAEYETKKPDAIIVQKPNVIAAIEYKDVAEFRTKAQIENAIEQEIGTARALRAKVYIVTDGSRSLWINPATGNQVLLPDGSPIHLNFNKNNQECVDLLRRASVSLSHDVDALSASAVVDPLPLARRVWQDLWAVSGATPEKCLYTFVEVFIFKFLSDLGILAAGRSFQDLLEQFGKGSDEEALRFYAQLIRPEIKRHFRESPIDHTTVINGMIFVTKDGDPVQGYATTFKTICKRFEQFGRLDEIDRDFKSRLFETFLKESISKKNWGQFFTPLKVVRAIVNMADINEGMSVCDPACGVGKFLLEPLVSEDGRFVRVEDGKLISKLDLTGLDKGFDKEEHRTIILAKANMMIYLSSIIKDNPELSEDVANLLNDTFVLQTNSILGTLAKPIKEKFDLILTNPPYVMNGSGNLKGEIAKSEILREHYAVNAMGVEGLFMEWIIRALKRGGKAFVVVPDGIMIRNHDSRLRKFIMDECVIDAVISLPINTFFTTNKKTYILALTRKRYVNQDGVKVLPKQEDPVLTYLCSEVGETRDVYRFPIEQNDLESAADCFNMFKGSKRAFVSSDPRCKLQPIERFKSEAIWSIDDWWSLDEKVELGLEDQVDAISITDYISMISDAASTLEEISGELKEVVDDPFVEASDPDATFKDFHVCDIFNVVRGSGLYTKRYIDKHTGAYPVYSGNTKGAFGYIDAFDFDSPCLSWSIDGLAGRMMKHETPFSATNHRGVLVPKDSRLNLDYVRLLLEPMFIDMKKGRIGSRGTNEYTSLPPYMVDDVTIAMPVCSDGSFDIGIQEQLSKQMLIVKEYLGIISDLRERLADAVIDLRLDDYPVKEFKLDSLMIATKGQSKYTKKYGDLHRGEYPVYSASHLAPLTHVDTYDYDGRFLTWATNGFAGKMLVLEGKFSINGDRAILVPKDDRDDIDIDYLKLGLEPIFRRLAKGRKGDRGSAEFTKLYVSAVKNATIPLPVDAEGHPSLRRQKEIAQLNAAVQQRKDLVLNCIDSLLTRKFSIPLHIRTVK